MPSSCSDSGRLTFTFTTMDVSTCRHAAASIQNLAGFLLVTDRQESSYSFPSQSLVLLIIFELLTMLAQNIRSSSLGISRCHSLQQKNVYGLVIVPNHNSLCWIDEIVWTICVELRMVQTFLLFRPEPPWKYQIWITNSSELNQIRSEPNRTTEKN